MFSLRLRKLAVRVRGKRVEVVLEHALKIHGGVGGIAPLARQTNPVARLTLNAHDPEFLEVALLNVLDHYLLYYAVVTQHIKQLHYYNWLHSATCFGRYPAIIRPTRNSVN